MIQHDILKRMVATLDEFRAALESEASHASVDLESVLEAHSRCHREVARAIRRLADEEEYANIGVLAETAASIDAYLKARLGDAIPSKYLTSGSPGKTRSVLLAYLLRNSGRPVSAARLRAISGDQTHTERRVRELRDYGYRVDSGVRSGETCYILIDEQPDTVEAGWRAVERKVESDGRLPTEIRDSLSMIVGERKARYMSSDQDLQYRVDDSPTAQYAEGEQGCPEDA